MRSMFYLKLAWENIRKNSQTYLPYILTCIGTIMMFYSMSYLAGEPSTARTHPQLTIMMSLGLRVIGIFAVIFLFYTHSFLMKRRKKEFGVFNILGMEKRHISRVLLIETMYVAVVTLLTGILGGILFSKLMYLIIMKLLREEVVFGFSVQMKGIGMTVLVFGGIFILTYLNAFRQIHLANPVELLSGGQVGEKEPKTKWIMTIIGAAALAGGYYIAITTTKPMDALTLFFVAVILVITGTYCLFIAGSIALLKMLKKNKKFYYQTKHFTSVSGMIYRMKQNAAGLANICILSTAVLVMISTTIALYAGLEDVLVTRYPTEVGVTVYDVTEEELGEARSRLGEAVQDYDIAERYEYQYAFTRGSRKDNRILSSDEYYSSDMVYITLITPDIYKDMSGKQVSLAEDEVLLFEENGEYPGSSLQIGDREWKITEHLDTLQLSGETSAYIGTSLSLIVPDKEAAMEIMAVLEPQREAYGFNYFLGINLNSGSETQIEVKKDIRAAMDETGIKYWSECREENRAAFYEIYGGLFFLGIFLGVLFLMATVLIIYYKQISEGYEDKQRFEIMQKVGMSSREVKAAIRSQVLTVFYLPLLMACVHTVVAFPVLSRLLELLNLQNTKLFALCLIITIAVFAALYAAIYVLTAKAYYKIVSRQVV